MKVKTSELIGIALDWAVTTIEKPGIVGVRSDGKLGAVGNVPYSPSTDWVQGGPIIEREKIAIDYDHAIWNAAKYGLNWYIGGPTSLIAAMRCYVSSKLGEEVEVPEELTKGNK